MTRMRPVVINNFLQSVNTQISGMLSFKAELRITRLQILFTPIEQN